MNRLVWIFLFVFSVFSCVMGQDMPTASCYNTTPVRSDKSVLRSTHKSNGKARVGIYFEVDHQAFLDHGSDTNRVHLWLNGLFAEMYTIYDIHNIELYISDVHIWTGPDIYTNDFNNDELILGFGDHLKDGFQGHVAQLLTTKPIGGGKAILNGICMPHDSITGDGPYSVATALSTDLNRNATFSWSVYVMAHEIGHILGSPHSHACFWGPNGDLPLDNCFSAEGDCESGPSSSAPGSIMSYCFMRTNGVDFSLGLGAEPGAYIYNNLISNSCLDSCEGAVCDDNDECTMDDRMDEYCNCQGTLIDINKNDLCDIYEPCDSLLVINQMHVDTSGFMASNAIMNYGTILPNRDILMSAGEEIVFMPGAEISNNSNFSAYLFGCQE